MSVPPPSSTAPPPPSADASVTIDPDVEPADQCRDLLETDCAATVLRTFLDDLSGQEVPRLLDRLDPEERVRVLATLEPRDAASILESLPEVQATGILEDFAPEDAARIVAEMHSDEQADLITQMDAEAAEPILAALDPEEADEIRTLCQYDPDVAGGLMVTEFLAYAVDATVRTVIDDLRAHADAYRDYDVQYAYVIDGDERLVGVLRMRDLLLAAADRPIADLMIADPHTVDDQTPLMELAEFFERHHFFGAPVVDGERRLLGVLERSHVEEAIADRADDDYRKSQGIVGGEELRSMPVALRSRRRLAWLSINIVLNMIAASVIAVHEETLQRVIALAVFLPIISDMSGCSGNQAVAVSMREITLGLVRPRDILRVLAKELAVGIIIGIVLGLLLAGVAFVWKGDPWLGLVVGGALCINTLVAVSIGGAVPVILKGFDLDPALASGPILTTVTDLCGFLLALTFASMIVEKLAAGG